MPLATTNIKVLILKMSAWFLFAKATDLDSGKYGEIEYVLKGASNA